MPPINLIHNRENLPSSFLILFGAVIIAVVLVQQVMRQGRGLSTNEASVAIGGLAFLATGFALHTSVKIRRFGMLLLVGVAVAITMLAADLFVLENLQNFVVKHFLVGTIVFCFELFGLVSQQSAQNQGFRGWLAFFLSRKKEFTQFLGVAIQLALLVLVMQQYHLEHQAIYHNMMLIAFYGFVIHFFLPAKYQPLFFLLLSLAAIPGILGFQNGVTIISVGLVLLGVAHLPVPFFMGTSMLLTAGILLAMLRTGLILSPMPTAVWPIFGSMFMFRLIIYRFDLNRHKHPTNLTLTLSYFFLLPNVTFPLFPVVDFSTFQRTYCQGERFQIYQNGVKWIFCSVIRLIFYRLIDYYLALAPEAVSSTGELISFVVGGYLLYLRITGQFFLVIGILHLFGFNLPKTSDHYFLASSVADLLRRTNTYWRDFLQKVFFYPAYFRLRRWGMSAGILLSIAMTIAITWLLHVYQWFWLTGSVRLTTQDFLFWVILYILLVLSLFSERKRGSNRFPGLRSINLRDIARLSLQTTATFTMFAVLWSLWTSSSLSAWVSLWSIGFASLTSILLALFTLTGITVFLGCIIWIERVTEVISGLNADPPGSFRPAILTGVFTMFLILIGNPAVYRHFGERAETFMADFRTPWLSDRALSLSQHGYYETLASAELFNRELWKIYDNRPYYWPLIQDTPAAYLTGDFGLIELAPLKRSTFHGAMFTTNRWGMRDQDYDQLPIPGTYRIALLGPSYVMGSGVADDEPFEVILEDRLNRQRASQEYSKYEILNFGIAGSSALSELWLLENKVLSFRPDAIFFISHHLEEAKVVTHLAHMALTGIEIPYDYLREIVLQAGIEQRMSQDEAEQRLKLYSSDIISWTYNRIVVLAQQHRILPVWIYLLPPERDVPEETGRHLTKLATEADFSIINLSDVYADHDLETLIVAKWDRHPNAAGHQLIANHLYLALQAKRLVFSGDQ